MQHVSPPQLYCCCVQHVSTITSTARVSRQIYRIAKDLLVRRKWQGNLRSGIPSARLYFTAEFYLTVLWASTPSPAMRNPFSKSAATRQRIDLYQMRSPMNASAKLWPNLPSWPIARVHQVSIFIPTPKSSSNLIRCGKHLQVQRTCFGAIEQHMTCYRG